MLNLDILYVYQPPVTTLDNFPPASLSTRVVMAKGGNWFIKNCGWKSRDSVLFNDICYIDFLTGLPPFVRMSSACCTVAFMLIVFFAYLFEQLRQYWHLLFVLRNTKKLSFCDVLKIIWDELLACIDVDAWQACGAPERCGILGETVCTICFIFSPSAKLSKDDRRQ